MRFSRHWTTLEGVRLDGQGDNGEERLKNLAKLMNLRIPSLGVRSEANIIDNSELGNLEVLMVA